MIGFVFLLCLLFRWGVLHRVLLVVGWCRVLYSSGFLSVSSHYLILSRLWRRQLQPTPVLLPGKSHGQRSLVGYSPWSRDESDTTEWLHFHFSLSCMGEGNGNPLQCSCLENPRDGGALWGAIYGLHRIGHDWSELAAAAAAGLVLWYSRVLESVLPRHSKVSGLDLWSGTKIPQVACYDINWD